MALETLHFTEEAFKLFLQQHLSYSSSGVYLCVKSPIVAYSAVEYAKHHSQECNTFVKLTPGLDVRMGRLRFWWSQCYSG